VPRSGRDLAINGHDLMDLGLAGPDIGRVQKALLHDVIAQPKLNNREWLSSAPANTWVVSDTHFGHQNIVGFCHRPLDHEQVDDRGVARARARGRDRRPPGRPLLQGQRLLQEHRRARTHRQRASCSCAATTTRAASPSTATAASS
jgi:hypothetical protein